MHMLEPTPHSGLDSSAHMRRHVPGSSVPQTLPDLLLIERARAGDSGAIEALIRRYGARLFRVAYSVLLDSQRAEAVVLEAFLAAFADLSRYEPTGKFAAWLTRLAYAHARAQRNTARGAAAGGAGAASPADAPESLRERRELEQSISTLPEVFRTVYVLRMVEGISGIETAASLGLHETTVRTRLFRAHRRLPAVTAERLRAVPALLELSSERLEGVAAAALASLARGSTPTISAAPP
jgi:RNA polymerase sigma-70 factor, ECF subfamily